MSSRPRPPRIGRGIRSRRRSRDRSVASVKARLERSHWTTSYRPARASSGRTTSATERRRSGDEGREGAGAGDAAGAGRAGSSVTSGRVRRSCGRLDPTSPSRAPTPPPSVSCSHGRRLRRAPPEPPPRAGGRATRRRTKARQNDVSRRRRQRREDQLQFALERRIAAQVRHGPALARPRGGRTRR